MDIAWDSIEKELKKIRLKRFQGKRLLLMGRIEHVCLISAWLQGKGLKAEAILDNDRKKQGRQAGNLPIVAPGQMLVPFRKEFFIIIYSPRYWESMEEQLAEYGYAGDDFVYVLDKPGLSKNIRAVIRGYGVYRRLQKEYGKSVRVFLVNCPLGDFYLLGLYFYQYCEEHHDDNYVIAGMSQGIEKLSVWFSFKSVKRLRGEESDALTRAWIFLGEDKIRLKPLTIWQGAFRFNPCQIRQRKDFSFLDTFTRMVYGLDIPVPRYPVWSGNRGTVGDIFRRNGLKPGKTVILSPFAYSLQSLPSDFWVELSDLLKKKGCTVAVNVGEEREHNFIKDSVTLRLEFAEAMVAMEMAGTVIGMRSGFFDITARAKCRRIVLYPPAAREPVDWNSTDIGFCSLKRMGLCGDAYEWEAVESRELFDKILSVL